MNYYFKPVTKENLKDIQYLIEAVYGEVRPLDTILKKYDTTKFGLFTVGVIAYCKDDDEPSGYYGVFPVVFNYKNKTILAAQSGDTMTHPNHRRKGLFTILAQKAYDLCKEKEIEFVFGFPVEASYYAFIKKLQWQHIHNIVKYQFYTPSLPISIFQRVFKKGYFKFVKLMASSFLNKNSFPFSNEELEHPKIKRSDAFYDYKNKEGNFNLKFLGINVWIQIKGESMIVSDLGLNKYSIKNAVFKLKLLSLIFGTLRIVFYVSPNSDLNFKLSKLYQSKKGLAIGYLDLLDTDIPLEDMTFTYADFDTF